MPSPRFLVPALSLAVTGAASAQQFVDSTATAFPSPNPVDYTNYVDVGDIDNDGDLDLVFANGGGFTSPGANQVVRVFTNIMGFGRFNDATSTSTAGITGLFRGVMLGDVDRDGDLDMVLAQDFNRQSKLLINDGTGVFSDQTAARLPSINLSATRAAFGDIDNDGDLDIYINNGGAVSRFGCGQNRIWMNDGTGHYTDGTVGRHPLGNVCQPMDAIFGDIDNDFDLDLRTGNRGSSNPSKLYLNDGTGSFTDGSAGTPNDGSTYSYDLGDINGDGLLDMVGANSASGSAEQLLENNGGGIFTDVTSQITPNSGGDDNDSKFFDLDMDGDLDLIIAALFQGTEKIYLNDGAGNFTGNNALIESISDATLDIAVADFNSDGRPDVVTAQGESGNFQNRIYLNLTGPSDDIAPNVDRTEQVPDSCDTIGPYVVRAAIYDQLTSDRGFYDDGVSLSYSVNGGAPTVIEMFWVGNSMWRGEIPGVPAGSSVEYFVEANDRSGNTGAGSTLSFDIGGALGDLNGDMNIGFADLNQLLAAWGPCPGCPEDLDGDGSVGFTDLNLVLMNWGPAAGCP